MKEILFLDNPRRRRHRSSTKRRVGSTRRRRKITIVRKIVHAKLNPQRSHTVMKKRRHHKFRSTRRFRKNPPTHGAVRASIGGVFKDSLLGVAGIAANNFASQQIGGM